MRHLYKINQNKTYAPLEVKGAQGRNIGVKGSCISESENKYAAVTCPNFFIDMVLINIDIYLLCDGCHSLYNLPCTNIKSERRVLYGFFHEK